jgi:oligopeptide/dipeptide ABC transporter ATP-binding protein
MESGNSEALVDEPLHPYTRLLMAAVPLPDPVADRARRAARAVVVGEPPSPAAPPAGCRFCTRCPEAAGVRAKLKIDCATVAPAIATVAPGHEVACHLYAPCRPGAG